ncbi:MAG: PDZ domain-containing protein [Nitrospiraceae bacterium]|nr:PDZ domain-containing protein [Nitrospiraceae bacterium]
MRTVFDFDVLLRRPGFLLAVNVCLGLLLCLAVLFFARDIVSIALPAQGKVVRPEKKVQQTARYSLQDYAIVLKNNPFGFPAGELKPLSAAPGAEAAPSDIALIGTISGPRRLSYAFFADKTGLQEVFKAGDKVFGMGVLDRIEKDRVFIRANGRDTEIRLTDIAVVKEVNPQAAAGSLGRRTGELSFVLDQQRVQQALEKPDHLMTDARFVPNIVEGKQQGFVLREVKPGGIYASLGLQNGDVLLKINDFTISNPETALQAVTALRGIDRAQLDVIRNSSRLSLTYQIR